MADKPANTPSFAGYANYVAQTVLANATGTTGQLPNPLATAGLNTAILVDPQQIEAYKDSIAGQMNAQSAGPKFSDLSERIKDIRIHTRVQGAGTLELHVTDPMLVLAMSGFVRSDTQGRLWPPINVKFPSGTECTWRLCQLSLTWQPSTDANMIMTFEDEIVSQLRDIGPGNGGLVQGQPNQTLGGFFKMLVDNANQVLHANIRLLELIDPQDPNYTLPVTTTSTPSHLRSKLNKGLTGSMQQLLNNLDSHLLGAFPDPGQTASITDTERLVAGKIAQLQALTPSMSGISSPPGGGYSVNTNNPAGAPVFTPNP